MAGPLPSILVNGQVADAAQVMADLNALLGWINNILPSQIKPGTITGAVTWAGNPIAGAYGGVGKLLETKAASASPTIDFTANITAAYGKYLVLIHDLVPAVDGGYLGLRFGTGPGPTWHSGAFEYAYGYRHQGPFGGGDGGSGPGLDNDGTMIRLTREANGIGAPGGLMGSVLIGDPSSGSIQKIANYQIGYIQSGINGSGSSVGSGYLGSNLAVTGLRFFLSNGNIASGTFELWGLN